MIPPALQFPLRRQKNIFCNITTHSIKTSFKKFWSSCCGYSVKLWFHSIPWVQQCMGLNQWNDCLQNLMWKWKLPKCPTEILKDFILVCYKGETKADNTWELNVNGLWASTGRAFQLEQLGKLYFGFLCRVILRTEYNNKLLSSVELTD